MAERLKLLQPRQALTLLRNSFSIPKLQYLLRASPAFKHVNSLKRFDELIRTGLSYIINIRIEDYYWEQAALPIRLGGLGMRKAVDVAFPAFIPSVHSIISLVSALTSRVDGLALICDLEEATAGWSELSGGTEAPPSYYESKQKAWDEPLMKVKLGNLLSGSDRVGR